MNTSIKIKEEKIDDEYDKREFDNMPIPIIVPKKEPTTTNFYNTLDESKFDAHAIGSTIQIKVEPKDNAKPSTTTKESENSTSAEVPLPINVKTEKLKKFDSSSIDKMLANMDDSFLDDLDNIENDKNNIIAENINMELNVEEGEIIENDRELNKNIVDTEIKDLENKIRIHKEKIEKHKKHKRNKESKVKKEKKKRSYNKSDSDDDSRSKSPSRQSSKKMKKLETSNGLTLPRPTIVKVEPHLVLPKPIEANTIFKKIKLEKQNSLSTPIDKVLKRCSNIINNIEMYDKNKYSTRILYTPTNFIPPTNLSNIENRSPLLCLKNVQFKFSSSSKINYKDFGIISPPVTVGNLARVIGFQTSQLIDLITSKVSSLNVKSENDINKSFLNNVSSFSSFYTNMSTQTDKLPCDQCVIRQLRKRNDISVQAVAGMNEIAVQTEEEDELPMIKEFHTLNMNQQLALNDFYSIIISGQPSNANDKLKLRDRLVQIYDMANQQIINPVSLIAPPAPVLQPNPYNSIITQSQLGYMGGQLPATSQIYDQYYHQQSPHVQAQQIMILDNYQQQQPRQPEMYLNSQQISRNDPRHNPNDPRNKTNNSRFSNSKRY